MLFDGRGERAAEEYRTLGIDLEQRVRPFSEIDGLYEPSAESLCLLDVSIEIGQALDVDQASSHRPGRGLLMVWRILPGVTMRTCCWERSWSR